MIEDSISLGLSLVAGGILIYLMTFMGVTTLLLIPMFLLLFGFTFQLVISKKYALDIDESTDRVEARDTLIYMLFALGAIGVGSFVSRDLFRPPMPMTIQLSLADQYLYGVMYAICEEQFFRGAVTSFFMWKTSSIPISSLFSGGFFMVYHFKVYGSAADKLMYVAIAGAALSYAVLKSRRLSSSGLAHIGNNLLAVPVAQVAALVTGGLLA